MGTGTPNFVSGGGAFNWKLCAVCGEKRKPWRLKYDLCDDCYKEYGKDRTTWPEWVRFLVNDFQRQRYRRRRSARELVDPYTKERTGTGDKVTDFDDFLESGELRDNPTGLKTRTWPELGQAWGTVIPWAPYDNKDDNQRYRKTNSVRRIKARPKGSLDYGQQQDRTRLDAQFEQQDVIEDATNQALTTLGANHIAVYRMRIDEGLTQEQIAGALGVSQQMISKYELQLRETLKFFGEGE